MGGCICRSAQQTLKDTEEPVRVLRGEAGMGHPCAGVHRHPRDTACGLSKAGHCDRGPTVTRPCAFMRWKGAELGHLQLRPLRFYEHLSSARLLHLYPAHRAGKKQQQPGPAQEASGAADCPGSLVGMGLLIPARRVCSLFSWIMTTPSVTVFPLSQAR